jgi:hypothetical protein
LNLLGRDNSPIFGPASAPREEEAIRDAFFFPGQSQDGWLGVSKPEGSNADAVEGPSDSIPADAANWEG